MVEEIYIVERHEGYVFPAIGEAFIVTTSKGKRSLWLRCPRCEQAAFLDDHELTIEADGSPTITPSIGCQQCHYHAFLRHGKLEVLSDW